jgi:tetratricopeptide (TPR) repeat protein
MQVLVVLADAAGGVVTRDALIETCWDGRIVSSDAINRAVLRVRQAARGAAAGSFELQTIPKIGFRLVAPPAASNAPVQRPTLRSGSLSPWRWTTLVLVSLAIGGGGLALAMSRQAERPSAPEKTLSPAVQDLSIRATAAVFEGTPQQLAQGISYFRQATRQSPDVAELWGSLAMANTLNEANLAPPQQPAGGARIREAAQRALDLDPRETHAWAALTSLTPTFRAWPTKERLVADAVAGSRVNGPPVMRQEVLFLTATGRTHAALRRMEDLYRAHPIVPFLNAEFIGLLVTEHRLEQASAVAAKARQLWPHDHEVWRARFVLALADGQYEDARRMAEDRATWPPQSRESDMAARAQFARALESGRRADADATLDAYDRLAGEGQGYLEEAIVAAAALGRPDAAFRWADRLYGAAPPAERYRFLDHVEYAVRDDRATGVLFGPFAERLWTDSRFLPLLDRIGLTAYWRGRSPPDFCLTQAVRTACSDHGLLQRPLART